MYPLLRYKGYTLTRGTWFIQHKVVELDFIAVFINYNKGILHGIISKLYNIQGTSIIKAITIGNKTVQQ